MSSEVATQIHPGSSDSSRGTGKKTNRSRENNARGANRNPHPAGNKKGKDSGNSKGASEEAKSVVSNDESKDLAEKLDAVALSEEGDEDLCWICAEPVKYYAISECNHRTCHVCAIRLRALYKKTECTFCKEPQTHVIFTTSKDTLYSSFTPESTPCKDPKLSVSFETQEMMEDTLLLLRFNCPDPLCDYIGNGWGDLKLHARGTHGKLMCDLCIRSKKVFSHEHTLYSPSALALHLPSMNIRQGGRRKEPLDRDAHPLCAFCQECYFGDDELYKHMRERHEECFVCKRNEVRDQYFQSYETLERHFNTAHFPCNQADCLAQKFVVFNSLIDLQAHMVEVHGGDMTARDKKDARRIQADFGFEEVGYGGRNGRRDRDRDRDRDREPPPQPSTSNVPNSRPTPTAGNKRREGFGGALTTTEAAPTPAESSNANRQVRPSTPQLNPAAPATIDTDPAIAEQVFFLRENFIPSQLFDIRRHSSFLARLQALAPNPTTAVPAVKAASRGYRFSESSARDLISTVWNVLDRNLDHTASIINAFIDLLEEEEKKQDLLSSWKGFALEQRRQFPDLVPTAIGSGYAGITSGRVLNAKHSTATRSSQSQQVWNRVALAASDAAPGPSRQTPLKATIRAQPSQERFPALGGGGGQTSGQSLSWTPSSRPGQRTTPWSTSSAQPSVLRSQATPIVSVHSSRAPAKKAPPPKLSNSLFPELPTSSNVRSKPQVRGNVSLKNILGTSGPPAVAAWGSSGGGAGDVEDVNGIGNGEQQNGEDSGTAATPGGKGKKSKGKQKQTLFTLGSFPT